MIRRHSLSQRCFFLDQCVATRGYFAPIQYAALSDRANHCPPHGLTEVDLISMPITKRGHPRDLPYKQARQLRASVDVTDARNAPASSHQATSSQAVATAAREMAETPRRPTP